MSPQAVEGEGASASRASDTQSEGRPGFRAGAASDDSEARMPRLTRG